MDSFWYKSRRARPGFAAEARSLLKELRLQEIALDLSCIEMACGPIARTTGAVKRDKAQAEIDRITARLDIITKAFASK